MNIFTLEAVIEKVIQFRETTQSDVSYYGVARLASSRTKNARFNGSSYVLSKFDNPHCSEVLLREDHCVPIPKSLGLNEALLAPALGLALSFWDRLSLELGEVAIYTEGGPFSDLVGQVAVWRGGCPVIKLCDTSNPAPQSPAETQFLNDPEEVVHKLRARTKDKPGFAGIDLNGRPEIIDLLLEVVPRWGRLLLAGQTRQPLTVDFYNNVHRKGVLLVTSVFDPIHAFENEATRAYLPAAFRILQREEMAAICLRLVRLEHDLMP